MVSDKDFDQPAHKSSDPEPEPQQHSQTSGSAPGQGLHATNADGPAGDPQADVRQLYVAKFGVPQLLREGAIAYQFGADDIDALHATKLKAVQDAAFLRAAWTSTAVNDLDTGDPQPRWAMFVNGVAEDLHAARIDAAQAGVDSDDIEHADKIGSSGLAWDQQPAHRLLGRLEDLARQHYQLVTHSAEQAELIDNLTQRLETAEAALDALGQTVAEQDRAMGHLLGEAIDHHWSTSRPDTIHTPQSLAKLRDANATLAAATRDSLSPPQPTSVSSAAGTDIGTAVEVALDGADAAANVDPPQSAPPHPSSTPQPELEP